MIADTKYEFQGLRRSRIQSADVMLALIAGASGFAIVISSHKVAVSPLEVRGQLDCSHVANVILFRVN
jgi:hypothetical protein